MLPSSGSPGGSTCFLLPPTKEEVYVFARVCLSVCLLARFLQNACMDLDEMLRVDGWTNWLIFEPDPYYSPDAGIGLAAFSDIV